MVKKAMLETTLPAAFIGAQDVYLSISCKGQKYLLES